MENFKDFEKEDLMMIAKRVKFQIEYLTEEVDNCSKRMNEDYEYFFRWNAESMYKAQLQLSEYRKLREVILTGSLNDVRQYLENKVKNITYDLLNGSPRLSSTSATTSLAHTFKVEVKQEIRENFLNYLNSMKTTVKQ